MDETADVSRAEQASIVVRSASEEGVHEDFLGFFHAEDLTGEGFATLLCDAMTKMGLDMSLCRGLGFDGASSMRGKFIGCATVIQKKYLLAKVVHCFNPAVVIFRLKTDFRLFRTKFVGSRDSPKYPIKNERGRG